jgi:chromosome segregation ATPase
MVVKYAMGEREVIVQRKAKEEAEKKIKALAKEKEDLQAKVKAANNEKTKLQQFGRFKGEYKEHTHNHKRSCFHSHSFSQLQDVAVLKKDVDRWKEEVKVQEAKACVAASRLKSEVDAHRETREHLDKTVQHLSETRKEIDVTRKECADFMKRIRDDQNRSKTNEIEQSAKLIIDAAAATELETLRVKYRKVIDENNGLSLRIQKMEKERHEAEEAMSRLKETVTGQKREISDLLSQVAEMEGLRLALQREERAQWPTRGRGQRAEGRGD